MNNYIIQIKLNSLYRAINDKKKKMKMKKISTLILLIFAIQAGIAQNIINVKGKVFDKKDKTPLAGVFVQSEETNKKTVTDIDGEFELKGVKEGENLIFKLMGYKTLVAKAKPQMTVYLTPEASSLDEVVVSASKTFQKRKELPIAINSVTPQMIEETHPLSVADVLNQIPGVNMIDLGNEQHMMSIRLPISTKSLFLYLEDGIPIRPTGVFNHNALLEMNIDATQKIEVIRGPYSSLYGSGAVGGAINFITKNPTPDLSGLVGISGHQNGFLKVKGEISDTYNNTGVYVGGYYSQIKDGVRDYGDYDKTAITAKVTHKFNDSFKWNNTLSYIDYYSEMSGSLDETKFENKDYTSYYTFTFRDAKALRFNSEFDKTWNDKHSTNANLVFRDNSMAQNPSYRISTSAPFDSYTRGELNENSFQSYALYLQHNIKFDKYDSKLVLGTNIDYTPQSYYAKVLSVYRDSEGMFVSYEETGDYRSKYDTDILNSGFYAMYEFSPVEKLVFNAAIRYDIYSYDFNNLLDNASDYKAGDTKETYDAVTPRIGAVYNFSDNVGVYTNYSVGYIPPRISDLFRKTDVPLLNPTTFDNYEVGGWLKALDDKVYFDWALYYMKGKDEVVSVSTIVDGVTVRENKNVGESSHKGLELGLKLRPTKEWNLRFAGALSSHKYDEFVTKIIDGEAVVDYSGNEMPGAPKFVSNTNLTYKPSYLPGFRIGVEWQHVSSYYTDDKNTNKYDGYDIFNIRTGYNFKNFELFFNILNVEDTLYATRVSTSWGRTTYTPGMPRTYYAGITYKFKK